MSPSYPGLPDGQDWALSQAEGSVAVALVTSLGTAEVPGPHPQAGYRVYTGRALEITQDERA